MATHYLKYGSKEVVSGPQTLSPFLFLYLTGGKGWALSGGRLNYRLQKLRACVSRKAVCGAETSKEASISYLNPSANFCTFHIDPGMCNYRGRMYMCNNRGRTCLLPCTCDYYRIWLYCTECFVLQCFHYLTLQVNSGSML